MKGSKKIILVLILGLVIVGASGCGKTVSAEEQQNIMKEYATTYFNNHMIGIENQDEATETIAQISISMLKQLNELDLEEKYDLSKLSNCKDESYVDLTINTETQMIEKYDFHLECNY